MAVVDLFTTLGALALEHYFLFAVTSVLFYYVLNRETRNVPPGPTGLPIVGYIPFLSNRTSHKQLAKLGKKYGSVFSVNDYKSAIEFLNNEAIQDRPSPNLLTLVLGEDTLLQWKGQLWKEHRRFVLRALKAVGVGRPEIESLIGTEIGYMLDQIAKDGQGVQPVFTGKYLTPSSSNVVSAVIMGKRFDYDHPVRVKQDEFFVNNVQPAMPWTGYIQNFGSVLQLLKKIPFLGANSFFDEADEILGKHVGMAVDEQKETYKKDADANLVAAYLTEYDSMVDSNRTTLINPNRIPGLAANLLGAGSSTVKDAMEWAFLHCALFPDVQDKLIKELEDVIGYDRKPTYADRSHMPYTQAFLWESMRHASAIPINLPHVASSDVTIGGYTIPKEYHIYLNLWAIHHDPNHWDEPEVFKVERFLSPEGDKVVKHEAFMPFSTGRRSCPGEPLAQVELFVYLVMTLQRYQIKPPEGVELSLDGVMAFFASIPPKLHLVFANRK